MSETPRLTPAEDASTEVPGYLISFNSPLVPVWIYCGCLRPHTRSHAPVRLKPFATGRRSGTARAHQSRVVRGDRGLQAVAHAELAEQALHVALYRGLRQVELGADLG